MAGAFSWRVSLSRFPIVQIGNRPVQVNPTVKYVAIVRTVVIANNPVIPVVSAPMASPVVALDFNDETDHRQIRFFFGQNLFRAGYYQTQTPNKVFRRQQFD
ncbi:MAG: hypothetical protein ABIR24_11830 [Verrucomicrobiota bacterium]